MNSPGTVLYSSSARMGERDIALQNLAELFDWRTRLSSDDLSYVFLRDDLSGAEELTYGKLRREVWALARQITLRTHPGDRVILAYGVGLDPVRAFWACIVAGTIPVPAPAPDAVRLKSTLPRLRAIEEDARATLVLTTSQILGAARQLSLGSATGLTNWIATDELVNVFADEADGQDDAESIAAGLPVSASSLAYLQYTSGSTSVPRGVMIAHGNVLANCASISAGYNPDANSRVLSWLPYFHDYGLIHAVIWPLFAGIPSYSMSPITFLRRPLRWLEAVERFRISHIGAPNFAYANCAQAVANAPSWSADLRSLKVAGCGAEPINPTTMQRFCTAFAPYGLSAAAFTPGYGLAEATLVATMKPYGARPNVLSLKAAALMQGRVEVVEVVTEATARRSTGADTDASVRTIVGCGLPIPGTEIAIVNPASYTPTPLGANRVGEVWVASPSVASGYWDRLEQTRQTFGGVLQAEPDQSTQLQSVSQRSWLRTGDLGFVFDAELFITGRLKDLIIIHGRNYSPQDIEWTVERSHSSLRAGYGAAFSVDGEDGEQLVVVYEIERHARKDDLDVLISAIRHAVAEEHDLPVHAVVLIQPGGISRTSSGKIRRQSCKQDFLEGRLPLLRSDILPQPDLGVGACVPKLALTARSVMSLATVEDRRSALETFISELVGRLTGRDPQDLLLDASPIECGLDSLTAFQLLQEIETALDVALPPASVLGGDSLRTVAAKLLELVGGLVGGDGGGDSSSNGDNGGNDSIAVNKRLTLREHGKAGKDAQRVDAVGVVPLSVPQEGVWFVEKLLGPSSFYNLVQAVRLTGPLDVAALERSVQTLVDRHAALRTSFEEHDGVPLQVIHPTAAVHISAMDYGGAATGQRDETMRQLLDEEARRPFDLTSAPLLRVRLWRIGASEHLLFMATHHLVSDGWSMGVLARELRELYAAFTKGTASPLPPLQVEYANYVQWQRDRLKGERGQRDLDYWRRQLHGMEPIHLCTDRPRSPHEEILGRVERFDIDAELLANLKRLALGENVTLFMLLLAAFQTLLMRYTGEEDVAVGSPVAGRLRPGFDGVLGLFTNTLVLRTNLSGNPTFRELLDRIRQTTLDAYAHQEMPLDRLISELGVSRGPVRNPLYSVAFALQNVPDASINLDGAMLQRIPLHSGTTRADMWLALTESGGVLHGELEYNATLFDSGTMQRLAAHFRTLLAGIVAHVGTRLYDLPLLEDAERHRILLQWNDTARVYPTDRCVHELFQAEVQRHPDAAALFQDDRRLTYQELNSQANQLAHRLRELGVGPGVLVCLCVERSIELIAGILGILKAGGTYVPLDPQYPADRLAFMLEDSRATVLLTHSSVRQRLPARLSETVQIVCLDTDWRNVQTYPDADLAISCSPEQIAYVIYTSGSTGTPKGVPIRHRNLCNLINWHKDTYGVTEMDRATQLAGPAFDASVWEIWPYLTAGASVHIPADQTRSDPAALVQWLIQRQITLTFLPTPLAEAVLLQPWPASVPLRVMLTGGDTLHRHPVQRLPFRLVNHYGPTENTVVSSSAEVQSGSEIVTPPPIGRPLPNTIAYVVDQFLGVVPIGVPGELLVGGAQLSDGYLNRFELTAERFIPNPFSQEPGVQSYPRLYRTGDLVRYLADGKLEFLGRIDDQVKLRGFRVELREIERVLAQHTGIASAVVTLREDSPGMKRLAAYVVPSNGAAPNATELREQLRRQLPDYMVPSTFVALAQLPVTPNGKVDRAALPSPDEVREQFIEQFIAPRTHIEEQLAGIWADVLRTKTASVNDNFFELGGHSLLATQIVSRIRDTMQVDLPLRAMFEAPTIAELAHQIELLWGHDGSQLQEPPIQPLPRDPGTALSFPASFSQRRMWFVQQYDPEGTSYNIPFALRLTGALNHRALASSVDILVRRHEAFRTTFAVVNGEPVQVIGTPEQVHMHEMDLRGFPEPERVAEAMRICREETMLPFNLESGPLHRFSLLQLGDTDHIILWLLHHAVGDQWSAGVILRELAIIYRALNRGEAFQLSPLLIHYADFAAWQRRYLGGAALDEQLAYWRNKLAGIDVLTLPVDKPRPVRRSSRGSNIFAALPAATLSQLKRVSTNYGVTPFMTLLAGFKLLLGRYSGQQDIAVGSPIANRTRVVTEDLVGTMVNTLVMRTDLSGDPTFAQLLARVRETTLAAYAHQDFPFERLVEELNNERDASHAPLVQVLFNVVNAPMGDMTLDDVTLDLFTFDSGSAQFDLSISVDTEMAGRVCLSYAEDLFEPITAERMLAHYIGLIQQVVVDLDKPVSAYSIITDQEQRQIVQDWNRTATAYQSSLRTDELISEQARCTPDAIAVSMGNQQLTYAQLDARANQLANYLGRRCSAPGALVGICLERSPEMVVALLAVMKSGAAYVPLDPAFPRERLELMARDAGLATLLTHSNLLSLLPTITGEVIFLDRSASEIAQESGAPPEFVCVSDQLAYVLYTSGSTGIPKGVEIPHRALTNFLCAMRPAGSSSPGCTARDIVLSVTTLSFDIAGLELYLPLIAGARVELTSREELSDGRLLLQRINLCQPTLMQATPATWRMLIDAGWDGNGHSRGALRILCGGETLSGDLAALLLDRCAGLWNLYGPTETTIWSTVQRIDRRTDAGKPEISIGRPIANTSVYILDSTLHPVPVGVPGELFIGGHGLARGYHNRPDLTTERFVANPHSAALGDNMYSTGDLARWLPDGRIVHLGRMDFQVKIRGFRVELGEIETVLARHPAIAQVVVSARDDRDGMQKLVAYVIPSEGDATGRPPVQELRTFLRATLPAYMVPSQFVFLETFPLTANNKIDVKALPEPDDEITPISVPQAEPHGRLEVQLTALWRQVLGSETAGVHDNFFDLGGHSLKAVQLLSYIKEVTGRQLPLATLFQAPTVAQMAQLLTRSGWEPSWRSLVAIQPSGSAAPIFAIPGIGGNVLVFAKLSKLLGANQPFYGLQSKGLDGTEQPFTSISAMAAHHIGEIRSVRPHGPYVIAGSCTGGVAAYEIAQQLRAQGEQITLIIIESWPPSSYHKKSWPGRMLEELRPLWLIAVKLVNYAKTLAVIPLGDWPEFFRSKVRRAETVLHKGIKRTLTEGDFHVDHVARATLQAVAAYSIREYPDSLLNVVAANRIMVDGIADTRAIWNTMAKLPSRITFIPAEDSGRLFVSPHVEVLSELIADYIGI